MFNNQLSKSFFDEREHEINKRWKERQKNLIQQEQQNKSNPILDPNHMETTLPDDPQTDVSFDPDDITFNI